MSGELDHLRMLSSYNTRANQRLYGSCSELTDEARKRDRGAFFTSIHGTLNHIMVGDRIWMARFRGETVPSTGLDEILFENFEDLREQRRRMDGEIEDFVAGLDASFLTRKIEYVNNESNLYRDPVSLLFPHMFNHQTHHRGQVHDMICRTEVDSPVLDMHRVIKPEPDERPD